jgi:hypothetical protein
MRIGLAVSLLAGLVGATVAQEGDLDKSRLYVTDPAACQALEEKGADAWEDLDFFTFSYQGGIQSRTLSCNVYDVKQRPDSDSSFVSTICELPGDVYPDTLAVTTMGDNMLQVVSAHDEAMIAAGRYQPTNQGTSASSIVFHGCDTLSEISFD